MNSSSRGVRRALLPILVLAIAALTVGCNDVSNPEASQFTTAPATTPAATSAPATTAPAGASATTPASTASGNAGGNAGSGLQPCSSRYLRGDAGLSQGTAGSIFQVITFTNLNNVACTLYGYPGVSLANGTPVTQVGAAADRDTTGGAPTTVTLQPQGVASATLRIVEAGNFPAAKCDMVPTTWLVVYPPGQYAPLYVSYKSNGCKDSASHLLTITPVVPGNGGGPGN